MRVPIDSDVLLHVASERTEFVTESTAVVVAWHSLSDIHYVGRGMRGDEAIRDFLGEILGFLTVPSTNHVFAR